MENGDQSEKNASGAVKKKKDAAAPPLSHECMVCLARFAEEDAAFFAHFQEAHEAEASAIFERASASAGQPLQLILEKYTIVLNCALRPALRGAHRSTLDEVLVQFEKKYADASDDDDDIQIVNTVKANPSHAAKNAQARQETAVKAEEVEDEPLPQEEPTLEGEECREEQMEGAEMIADPHGITEEEEEEIRRRGRSATPAFLDDSSPLHEDEDESTGGAAPHLDVKPTIKQLEAALQAGAAEIAGPRKRASDEDTAQEPLATTEKRARGGGLSLRNTNVAAAAPAAPAAVLPQPDPAELEDDLSQDSNPVMPLLQPEDPYQPPTESTMPLAAAAPDFSLELPTYQLPPQQQQFLQQPAACFDPSFKYPPMQQQQLMQQTTQHPSMQHQMLLQQQMQQMQQMQMQQRMQHPIHQQQMHHHQQPSMQQQYQQNPTVYGALGPTAEQICSPPVDLLLPLDMQLPPRTQYGAPAQQLPDTLLMTAPDELLMTPDASATSSSGFPAPFYMMHHHQQQLAKKEEAQDAAMQMMPSPAWTLPSLTGRSAYSPLVQQNVPKDEEEMRKAASSSSARSTDPALAAAAAVGPSPPAAGDSPPLPAAQLAPSAVAATVDDASTPGLAGPLVDPFNSLSEAERAIMLANFVKLAATYPLNPMATATAVPLQQIHFGWPHQLLQQMQPQPAAARAIVEWNAPGCAVDRDYWTGRLAQMECPRCLSSNVKDRRAHYKRYHFPAYFTVLEGGRGALHGFPKWLAIQLGAKGAGYRCCQLCRKDFRDRSALLGHFQQVHAAELDRVMRGYEERDRVREQTLLYKDDVPDAKVHAIFQEYNSRRV